MKNNVSIRPYRKADRQQVQNICIATGGVLAERAEFKDMLLNAFCNYYIERESENCFVAADEEEAVGYILCAANCDAWVKCFEEAYVNKAENEGLKEFYKATMATPLKYAREYPAHLHIDILPEYQRMGIGFLLMDALIGHLRAAGVRGLMLCVAADNIKGLSFYEKYGFKVLERTSNEIAMGMTLSM